jgi:phosphoglycerate dehydrogenase-like enzyme
MRLILHEAAHKRVKDALADFAPQLQRVIVGAEGQITCDAESLDTDSAQPDAGWMSNDSMRGGGARALFVSLLKSRNLGWVQTGAAGVDDPIWAQLVDKGAVLTTGHGQAISIAEYVLASVLGHYQRLAERRAEQAAHRWTRLPFREIGNKRWLIVGFGAIGQAVAERARAFGAHVTGVRRSGAPHPAADRMGTLEEVTSFLPEADVVVLAAPFNAATRGLAGAGFFAAMKSRSVLVNIGRGALVDEAALLAALDKGVPEQALLDVFETEPLPAASPFWDHPRVTLTAHASAFGRAQRRHLPREPPPPPRRRAAALRGRPARSWTLKVRRLLSHNDLSPRPQHSEEPGPDEPLPRRFPARGRRFRPRIGAAWRRLVRGDGIGKCYRDPGA